MPCPTSAAPAVPISSMTPTTQSAIAEHFTEHQTGIGLYGGREGLGVSGVDEGDLDAEAGQGIFEQVVGTAVQ